jgi:hypothetical protein
MDGYGVHHGGGVGVVVLWPKTLKAMLTVPGALDLEQIADL